MSSHLLGHVANAVMLVSTGLFWLPLLLPRSFPYISSQSYAKEGFCVMDPPEAPLLNSHLLCFYFDTLAAAAFALLPSSMMRYSGVSKLRTNAVGIFGHGVGHLFLYLNSPLSSASSFLDQPLHMQVAILLFSISFFYMFFLSIPPLPKAHVAPLAILAGVPLNTLIPPQLSFSYVQTVLLCTSCFYESVQRDKPTHYTSYSVIVHLPVSFVGWLEVRACELRWTHSSSLYVR